MTTTLAVLIAVICILFVVALTLIIVVKKKSKRKSHSSQYINEQIYVGNLPYHINEGQLEDYFGHYGNIQSVRIIRNARTGRSKGYAFVTYTIAQEADAALESHGKDMAGRSMVVRIAKPRRS